MQQCPACATVCGTQARYCGGCGRRLPAAATGLLAGRYRLEQRLARGGSSTVWRAADLHVGGRVVAVKELAVPAMDEDAQRAVAREAAVLASLRHPAIPVIYDHIAAGSHHYLVMGYVDGHSLRTLLAARRQPVPEGQVRAWALQLCAVLAYLHGRQPPVVFRDLKPANILLAPDGRIRLVDFGIARRMAPGRADTVALGTAGYASPEHYSGHTDPRSDLYSLGATLHHLLTLRDPAPHPPCRFPPVRALNPAVSGALATLIEQLLQWRPDDRPASVAQVAAALLRLEAEDTEASGPMLVTPSERPLSQAMLVLRELRRGADEEAIADALSGITGIGRARAQACLGRLPLVVPLPGMPGEALLLAQLQAHGCMARRAVPETISATLAPEMRARLARHGQVVLRDHPVDPGGYGYCRRCGYHWPLPPAAASPPATCPRCRRRDWSARRLCRCGWCGHEFELVNYRRRPARWCPTCACCGLHDWERPGRARR